MRIKISASSRLGILSRVRVFQGTASKGWIRSLHFRCGTYLDRDRTYRPGFRRLSYCVDPTTYILSEASMKLLQVEVNRWLWLNPRNDLIEVYKLSSSAHLTFI